MKKKAKILSLFASLTIAIGLISLHTQNSYEIAYAEEEMQEQINEEQEITNEDVIITDVVEEEQHNPTELNQLIDKYFGWIVGIPVGTIITALGGVLITFNKLKEIRKESGNVIENVDAIKGMVSIAKNSLQESKDVTLIITNAIKDLNARFNGLSETLKPLMDDLAKANETNEKLTEKVKNLENIIALEIGNDPVMVTSGVASKVADILKSEDLPKNVKIELSDGVRDLIDAVTKVEEEIK